MTETIKVKPLSNKIAMDLIAEIYTDEYSWEPIDAVDYICTLVAATGRSTKGAK